MKRKRLLIATILFFLIVNASYFWEPKLGVFAILTLLIIIVCFFVLSVFLLRQIFFAFREKFIDKQRILVIVVMTFVLATSFLLPRGVIDFSAFESESLLVAQAEGGGNCTTTLRLRANNKFVERNVCFGIYDTFGEYFIKEDTIFFKNVSQGRNERKFYEFAIIKKSASNSDYLGEVIRYESLLDTTGRVLKIIKNEFANNE